MVVNLHPQSNLVERFGSEGRVTELPQTYYDRFEEAFVGCCLDGGEVPMGLGGAVEAVRVGGVRCRRV